jgi:hypothetical protein
VLAASTVLAALAVVASAAADKEKVHLTTADQARARTLVLRLADLGGATTGWAGGIRQKAAPDSPLKCSGFDPKQSDLVLTGKAESDFANTGLQFDSEVELLRTEQMVKVDWQRSVDAASLVPCLREQIQRTLPKGEAFVSFGRLRFPKLGDESAAFRGVVSVKTGGKKVKVMIDFTLVGVGRSEITLVTTAPYAEASAVMAAEQRLAKVLASRAVPPGAA